MIKELIGKDARQANPTKRGRLRCYLSLMTKTKTSLRYLETLIIKESCNLVGQEAELGTLNQK